MPCLGFRKYRGSTGTGLAQPNPATNIISRPIQSMCRRGFRLRRCMDLAVGSPRARAARPWQVSWTVRQTPRPAVKSGPARKAIPVNSAAYSSPCDDNPKDRSIIPVFPPQYKENHRNSKGFQAETSGAGAFAPAPDSAGLIISPSPWRRSPQRSSPASSRCPRR